MSLKLKLPLAQSNLHTTEAHLGVVYSEPPQYHVVEDPWASIHAKVEAANQTSLNEKVCSEFSFIVR